MTDTHVTDTQAVDDTEAQEAVEETIDNANHSGSEEQNNDRTTSEVDSASTDESSAEDEASDDLDAMVPLSKLKEVRREAKNLRDRLRNAESTITELQSNPGDQTIIQERDSLKAQVEALTKQARHATLTNLVTASAQEVGAIQPEAIIHLIDADAIEWDGDAPKNVANLVKDAKTKYARLFNTGNGNAGNRNERVVDEGPIRPEARIARGYSQRT
jgi:hypothetical protein